MSYGIPDDDRVLDVTLSAGQRVVDTDYPVLDNDDLELIRVREGVKTTFVIDVDYTVAAVGSLGYKRITLTEGALADDRLVGRGLRERARTSNLVSGELRSSVINREFQSIIILIQELARDQGYAVQLDPIDDASTPLLLPLKAERLGRYLRFNSTTGLPEAVDSPADVPEFHIASAVPTAGDGKDGDVWLIVNAVLADHGNVYGKAAGAWSLKGNIRGPTGVGDVNGPASATANAITRFDGATGKVIKSSGVTVDDNNDVAGARNLSFSGFGELTETGSAPSTPAAGKVRFYPGEDGLLRSVNDAGDVTIYGVSGAGVEPNLAINGDFQLNQRGFAGGNLSAGSYGFDRWKSSGVTSNLTLSGLTLTMTSGSVIEQVIVPNRWGFADLASRTLFVSVEDPDGNIDVDLGSVSGTIAAGSGRQGIQLTMDAGDTGNLSLKLTRTDSGSVSFGRVKVEVGLVGSGWQARPRVEELALAQEYYREIDLHLRVYVQSGEQFQIGYRIQPPMRAAPTADTSGMSYGSLVGGAGTVTSLTTSGFQYHHTGTSSGNSTVHTGTLLLDAEL